VDYVQSISDDDRTALLIEILDYLLDMGMTAMCSTHLSLSRVMIVTVAMSASTGRRCGMPIVEAKRVK